MSDFATIEDITTLFRPLTVAETERAQALLPIVSDSLRVEAQKVGKNLDEMVATNSALANVADDIAAFARKEGLTGHARSVLIRSEK